METLKKISVTVTYHVGLSNIKAPTEVVEQLQKIYDSGKPFITGTTDEIEHSEAMDWLTETIKERDCFEWECEIDNLEIE